VGVPCLDSKNIDLGLLQGRLNRLRADGKELVSMTSTIQTVFDVTGNYLMPTFKRPGVGEWNDAASDWSTVTTPWA
jgi:hypothetical protein